MAASAGGRWATSKTEEQAVDGVPGSDSVIELERAGDSAQAAAEADTGLSSDARESVLAAHLAIFLETGRTDRSRHSCWE